MGQKDTDTAVHQSVNRGWSKPGAVAMGVGGAALWAFARMPWIEAAYDDSFAGNGTAEVLGSDWSTETTALALLLVVGMIAGLALRRTGRRLVGAVGALAGIGAAVAPIAVLAGPIDHERVHSLLTAGSDTAQAAETGVIADWAEITATTVAAAGPVGALVGCVCAIVGGVALALRPGQDSAKLNKYEQETVRREKIRDDLESQPDSGRVMWDALDADIDPTEDPSEDPTQAPTGQPRPGDK